MIHLYMHLLSPILYLYFPVFQDSHLFSDYDFSYDNPLSLFSDRRAEPWVFLVSSLTLLLVWRQHDRMPFYDGRQCRMLSEKEVERSQILLSGKEGALRHAE